mmetsp:Transcript_99615/g.177334  ORF Transcript_99615/g.177334 Transcript_99615/m.177334 type:complete len:268 (+) Transcript_99615:96-899(+)|eukprot:CAMPEP_0197703576 /NCGR_PEP_ID=MMETSP1338-20131121/125506_1 /TAXON_ID=43686 ORGANISM="Pelagodinium beii, Strain RCC1491" /NCGR_SAMPLE_ID=MMETSP1338 /ASSEMBLY_ACC=CAM_ASM_000754 /LENGTH=267 /DNA_ID=CAMNT_0043287473 /DNA_START=91 /DNA_END=891 /DNA_ORIENTATION=+
MELVLRTHAENGGLLTEVEETTSFLSKNAATGIGAAAGGLGAFAICTSKCPGGVKGSLGSMLSGLNPLNLLPFGNKKEQDDAEAETDPNKKMFKRMDTVEKSVCNMNCKVTAILGAGAGAAAGRGIHTGVTKGREAYNNRYGQPQGPPPGYQGGPPPGYRGGPPPPGYGGPPRGPPPPGYYPGPPPRRGMLDEATVVPFFVMMKQLDGVQEVLAHVRATQLGQADSEAMSERRLQTDIVKDQRRRKAKAEAKDAFTTATTAEIWKFI